MFQRRSLAILGVLSLASVIAAQAPNGPAYQIVVRSHQGEAVPTRNHESQTGGGSVFVEQPEAHTIVITMGGAAVAGSGCCCSSAGINFTLDQDLDIVALRKGARPPRVGMVGRVIGTLQVTDPGKCSDGSCGSAEQGPATAALLSGGQSLLSLTVKNSSVGVGQGVMVNYREGPVESVAAVGSYHLHGNFRINANQGRGVWHRQNAVADFDPAPQLDAFWADGLRPFRAVPRRDFGFKLIVRVVEDAGQ